MAHTVDGDLYHFTNHEVRLSWILGLFWLAWLLTQGLEGIIERVRHGFRVCRENKQEMNEETELRWEVIGTC